MLVDRLSVGTAEGDGVLRVLNDPVQSLTHCQLQALVRAAAPPGRGQLLVGNDVTFFEAVSVATERLGVQQRRSGDAWVHKDKETVSGAAFTDALGLFSHMLLSRTEESTTRRVSVKLVIIHTVQTPRFLTRVSLVLTLTHRHHRIFVVRRL